MMAEVNLMEQYPRSNRKIDQRAKFVTEEHRAVARLFDERFFDGDRLYGYGGYKYLPGRWKPVAEALIENYNLTNDSSVLDVGCGKGFLLYELLLLLPRLNIVGIEMSNHAISNSQSFSSSL